MKTINGLPGIAESLLFALVVVVMVGCASTPENRATDEQPKITKEQRKIAEEERKAAKEQKHWQQALISYSDEQLGEVCVNTERPGVAVSLHHFRLASQVALLFFNLSISDFRLKV